MNKVALDNEWQNKESDFNFESSNEYNHNVEDFTKKST